MADDSVRDAVPDKGPEKSGPKRTDPTSQLARGELMHAEVKPLDLSGVPTVAVGIGAWLIALVVLLVFRSELEARGEEWWIWVAVAGAGLGLIGLFYTRHRWAGIEAEHAAEKAAAAAAQTSDDSSASSAGADSSTAAGSSASADSDSETESRSS